MKEQSFEIVRNQIVQSVSINLYKSIKVMNKNTKLIINIDDKFKSFVGVGKNGEKLQYNGYMSVMSELLQSTNKDDHNPNSISGNKLQDNNTFLSG